MIVSLLAALMFAYSQGHLDLVIGQGQTAAEQEAARSPIQHAPSVILGHSFRFFSFAYSQGHLDLIIAKAKQQLNKKSPIL